MIVRKGFALRWRVAALSSLAIALLSITGSITAYVVTRSNLTGNLQEALRQNVLTVADVYRQSEGSVNRDAFSQQPTGIVVIQLYTGSGLFAASSEAFQDPVTAAIDEATIFEAADKSVHDWRGSLAGRSVQAALAPFPLGVVAVVADTSYIRVVLASLARSLMIATVILVVVSALIGYLVAASAMRPISQLARFAAGLNPNQLEPLHYQGPQDEVGQLSNVLNDLIARLRDSMDAQRAFLATTSHELRTPLTGLQGFLERAYRRAPPDVKKDLVDARRISQTMSRLVTDLLQLSRGELVKEVIPHILDPVEDVLQPIAEEYPGVQVKGTCGEILLGDPERLRQLIRNLTSNAVRATGDASKVELSFSASENGSILAVSDDGPGIPAEALPHIFETFYKGEGGGAGLGLAIAKQIAESHHGRLEINSLEGKGTTFYLHLPSIDTSSDEFL